MTQTPPKPTTTLAYTQRSQRAAVADTVVAPTPRMTEPTVANAATVVPAGTGTARSTVLPRIASHGSSAELLVEGRPRYEPKRHLGAGAQADVTLAHDHDIDRTVALKRLRPDDTSDGSVLRFAEEVRTVGQLEHPNIVPIHDVGIDEHGQYFFVMKYVEGETLEAVIEKLREGDPEYTRRYTPEYRMQLCNEILRGVEHAHARGILHRDLKPANIMIGARGEVVVMDWGLAKRIEGDTGGDPIGVTTQALDERVFRTQAGGVVGTPAYMAPEQALGRTEEIGVQSDIYSLAVVFYELFCLQHPRAQHTTVVEMLAAVATEEIRATQVLADFARVGAPPALAHLVRHGLARERSRRYRTVAEMRQRLDRVRDGKAPIECHATFAQAVLRSLSRSVDRHPFALMVLLLVGTIGLLGGAGGLVWSLLR